MLKLSLGHGGYGGNDEVRLNVNLNPQRFKYREAKE
jgi:hypothetical protein